jgi:hypothetical protein
VNCPTKITYFNHILVEQDVLRLQISMQNIILMHVFDSLANLFHIFPYYSLRKTSCVLQVLIEIPSQTRLKYQVGCLLIDKEVIKMDYMRMTEKTLDLYFTDELLQGIIVNC